MQQHFASDVLIWQDEWDMNNTDWNPFDTSNVHSMPSKMNLARKNKTATSSEGSSSTFAIVGTTASVLALSILACAFINKRKTVTSEKEEGIHQPLL